MHKVLASPFWLCPELCEEISSMDGLPGRTLCRRPVLRVLPAGTLARFRYSTLSDVCVATWIVALEKGLSPAAFGLAAALSPLLPQHTAGG